jgi:type IV secretion system protein VirB4
MGVGGTHYEIGGDDSSLAFAPLQYIQDSEAEFTWACDWISRLYEVQGISLTPEENQIIAKTLHILKEHPADDRPLNLLMSLMPPDSRLKAGLSYYCAGLNQLDGNGPLAKLMDSRTDNLTVAKFTVFETEVLMNMGEKSLIPVLTYLFHRIEQNLKGQPVLLVLDEAWILLSNPVFRAKIEEWLRVMRKANCAVVLATQSISDADRSGIMGILVESCATKIFLANHEAAHAQQELYAKMGLNSKVIQTISRAIPKQDYYVFSAIGRRAMQLALGRKALAFVGSSSKEDIAKIKGLMREYPDNWINPWLDYKQVI